MKRRAVIVEDEPLATRALREMLEPEAWIAIIDEIADGPTAITQINRLRPDIVFLDIHLPEVSGIDVLRALEYQPAVVLTTAFDQFAVTAFELAAVDYLLKPFGRERLSHTLARVRRMLDAGDTASTGKRALLALQSGDPLDRLFVRDRDAIVPVLARDIERIEAQDDYVALFAGGKRYLANVAMGEIERRLAAGRFVRIHRSHMVNLEHVASLTPYDGSRLLVTMRSGMKLVASRSSSRQLRELAL